jgi:anaerobic magnesium-protoporphyrin IX monomethyl ester cyclase
MVLINSSPKNALKIFQPFFPLSMPPIGLGYLAVSLEKENINFKIVDEQIENAPLSLIDGYIKNGEISKPYIFGFSVLTASFNSALVLAKTLKQKYEDSIILFGGIHPTSLPEESLSFDFVDFVLAGEAERTLPQFYKLAKSNKDFSGVKNLFYKKDNMIIQNEKEFLTEDLDNYPFPYHMFHNPKYDLNFIMTSRGCPYNCIFCSNRITTGKPYRFRSSDSIVEELDLLNKKYKKTNIHFFDDNLLVNKKRIYELLEKIRQKGLDKVMTYGFQARGDNVDKQLLIDMYNNGFKSVFFGIESASNRMLEIVKKGETIEQIKEGIGFAKEAKMNISATFIYGLPTETKEDRDASMRFCKDMKLDIVRFNNATPYPGTELFEIAKKENRLFVSGNYENFNSVSTFIENPFKPIPFSYVPLGNKENEIRDDILISYFNFYFNLKKIRSTVFKAEKSTGWFSPGKTIFEFLKKIPAIILLFVFLSIKFSRIIFRKILK